MFSAEQARRQARGRFGPHGRARADRDLAAAVCQTANTEGATISAAAKDHPLDCRNEKRRGSGMSEHMGDVPENDPRADTALKMWGWQTICHATGLAAYETGTQLFDDPEDPGAFDRAGLQAKKLWQEARVEVPGDHKRFTLAFIRRIFDVSNEYLNGPDC